MRMIIQGGHHVTGRVPIMGAKNAILPLVAATVIVKGETRFKNVTRLSDLLSLLEILSGMGAHVEWTGEHELLIDSSNIDPAKLDRKKMKRFRGSILLLGPMLARFKKIMVPEPGGCSIGNRPIDAHLEGLGSLGATCETDVNGGLEMEAKELKGGYVIAGFSVTATENIVMAAVLAKGKTAVRLAAAEPHVQDLCLYLKAAGAKIKGIGTHELEIEGVKQLTAPKKAWSVVPDMVEIGTFAVAAAITRGDIEMFPVVPEHLDAIRYALSRVGVRHEITGKSFRVQGVGRMNAFRLQTLIYPGFPTDLQAPFGLLATQCHGTSIIHDPMFEARLGYINELTKMGANAVIADPHRVIITGPTPLRGTEIRSLDLRAGATMVLAGLIAEGETVIHDAEIVYRGYEALDERLRKLGADIVRQED